MIFFDIVIYYINSDGEREVIFARRGIDEKQVTNILVIFKTIVNSLKHQLTISAKNMLDKIIIEVE